MPYFDKVVSSWKELDYPRESLEIIIVDNASSDRSADYIREKILPQSPPEAGQPLAVGTLPKITFIENKTNEGFAGGNNRGIKYALEQGCDYIYLHNNDLYLRPDALGEAIEAAQSDDFIGCVQSLMLLWQNPEFVNSSGNMIHFLGFGFTGDYKTRVADLNESGIKEIAYASCAAALFKSDFLMIFIGCITRTWNLAGASALLDTKMWLRFHPWHIINTISPAVLKNIFSWNGTVLSRI